MNEKKLTKIVLNADEFFQKWGTEIGPIMEDYVRKAPEFPEEMHFAKLLGTFMADFESAYLQFKRDSSARGVTSCKFCHLEISKQDAHYHVDGWVGDCCWDERLRSTE